MSRFSAEGRVYALLETIKTIARSRTRNDTNPLTLLHQLDGGDGERISHLPVEGELSQAWQAMTGEPFRPHQAQAATALKRGDAVALASSSPVVDTTAFLLIHAALVDQPAVQHTALLLVPDRASAEAVANLAKTINEGLPTHLQRPPQIVESGKRLDPSARLLIATPDLLHFRLLRNHDRAWASFWAGLSVVALFDVHHYQGVAGAHLSELLLRTQRVAKLHSQRVPALIATMYEFDEPQPALQMLHSGNWRVVLAKDVPRDTTTFAVWHSHQDRLREASDLALELSRAGFHTHILCRALEQPLITPRIEGVNGLSLGAVLKPAHALVCAGFPGLAMLRHALRSGYQGVLLVLGQQPHEQMLLHHTESLLSAPNASWPESQSNAYVTAQHLLCAASEIPLTEAEIVEWGANNILVRLVERGQLIDLPDLEVAWKPTREANDPYAEFSMLAASGAAILANLDRNGVVEQLDSTSFERWTFVNAALPPGAGGLRVIARDEEQGSIELRPETTGRRTYPLRRCAVTIRDERETRVVFEKQRLTFGRVMVKEEVYAYREATPGHAIVELVINPPLHVEWSAPACWIDLPIGLQVSGQFVGWCLAAVLNLRTAANFTDLVPCYDHEQRRIYFVDSQPGGSGYAAWLFRNAEHALPLGYDIAYGCRTDALLEPLARADMDWMLTLLGKRDVPTLPTIAPAVTPTDEGRAVSAGERWAMNEGQRDRKRPSALDRSRTEPRKTNERPAEPPLAKPPESAQPTQPPLAFPGQPVARPEPPRSAPPPARATPEPPRSAPPPARATPEPPRQRNLPLPEAAPPAGRASDEHPPDASALIARLRRQREQREAQSVAAQPARATKRPAISTAKPGSEPRFQVGDQIFCLPYGDGTVTDSWFDGDREMLTVSFPDHGELTVDPAVSLVRKLDPTAPSDDELL
jgi:hypothetical protein